MTEEIKYKNELVKLNVNWSYGQVNGSAVPMAVVDFEVKIHDLQTNKDHLMIGKHLVGEVEVKKIDNK